MKDKTMHTQQFKSLEINPSKKIFKINGQDFGKYCEKYELHIYQTSNDFKIKFVRHGKTIFENYFNPKTGKNKSRSLIEENDF